MRSGERKLGTLMRQSAADEDQRGLGTIMMELVRPEDRGDDLVFEYCGEFSKLPDFE